VRKQNMTNQGFKMIVVTCLWTNEVYGRGRLSPERRQIWGWRSYVLILLLLFQTNYF